jgi:tape measure domain-containing protein
MGALGTANVAIKGDTKPLVSSLAKARLAVSRTVEKMSSRMLSIGTSAAKAAALATAAFTGLSVYMGQKFARGVMNVGSSFENLGVRLNTLTRGKGLEWLEKLNKWALKMPVDTQAAVDAFANMRAMGVNPTLEKMTTLVDTMSAVGGGTETLQGIVRALGQISTKGKPSLEELYQLGERNVPVFDILSEKLGMTKAAVMDIGTSGISSAQVLDALWSGMAERFGGASKDMQNTWSGMMITLKSYWVEFQRMIADAGIFEAMKEKLKGVMDTIEQMTQSGALQAFAQRISDGMSSAVDSVIKIGKALKREFSYILDEINAVSGGVLQSEFFRGSWTENVLAAVRAVGMGVQNLIRQFGEMADSGSRLGGFVADVRAIFADLKGVFSAIGTMVSPAISALGKLAGAFGGVVKAARAAVSGIRKLFEFITSGGLGGKVIDILFDLKGKGSAVRPLSEKIDEMSGKFGEMRSTFEEPISPMVDFTGMREGLQSVVSETQQQIEALSTAILNYKLANNPASWSYTQYRQAARQLEANRADEIGKLNRLQNMGGLNGFSGGGWAPGPQSGHWELLHGDEKILTEKEGKRHDAGLAPQGGGNNTYNINNHTQSIQDIERELKARGHRKK